MVKSQVTVKVSPMSKKTFSKRVSLSTNEEAPPKVWCEFQSISQELRTKMRDSIVDKIRNCRGSPHKHMSTERFSKNLSVGVWDMPFDLAHGRKPVRVLGADCTSVLDFHPPSEIPEGDDPLNQMFQVWGPEGLQWLKDVTLKENRKLAPEQKIRVILLDPRCIPPNLWAETMKREGQFAKSSMVEHAANLGFKPLCNYEFENIQRRRYDQKPTTIGPCSGRSKLRETLRLGVKKLEQDRFKKMESEDSLAVEGDDELVALAEKKDARMYGAPSSDDFVIDYNLDGSPARIRKVMKWSSKKCRKRSKYVPCPRAVSRVEMTMTSDSYPFEEVLETGVNEEQLDHEWWACSMDE